MATNINTVPATKVIDPNFYIPEGLGSFVYAEDTTPIIQPNDGPDQEVTETFNEGESVEDSDIGGDTPVALGIPDNVTIISQTIRMSADGRQLVDVVLDVDDIDGAVQMDVRTTKVG